MNLKDIEEAQQRISRYIKKTHVLRAERLDDLAGCRIYLKPENLQVMGSFKVRGALNKLMSMSDEDLKKGVIAASSGNHAQGVAYAAKIKGVRATIIFPEDAPKLKLEGASALGAEILKWGLTSKERYERAYELVERKGAVLIHSFDDPYIIAGQGTIGLEILDDIPDVDTVVTPVGGGGMISGISVAVKNMNPRVRIIGVEPAAVPRYTRSLAAGRPVEVDAGSTIADGLRVVKPGELNFELIRNHVDEIVTVDEGDIKRAMLELIFLAKLLVEPSAAVGLAALISGRLLVKRGEKVCLVLSGGNVDRERLKDIL